MRGADVAFSRCAAWSTEGVTVAGRDDATLGDAVDALFGPTDLYATRDGRLYVADSGNDRVMKYTVTGGRNGTQIGDGSGNGIRQMNNPSAVAVDEENNLVYISDYGNSRVLLWNEEEAKMSVQITAIELRRDTSHPDTQFAVEDLQLNPHSKDALYILQTGLSRVSRWKLDEEHTDNSFNVTERAYGIHVDAQLNIYLPHWDPPFISKWVNGKHVDAKVHSTSLLNRLSYPFAVSVDGSGSMFITDTLNHRIVRWETDDVQGSCLVGCSTLSGNRNDQLAEPTDVTFDWKGNLLVADSGNHRVQRFDLLINTTCGA